METIRVHARIDELLGTGDVGKRRERNGLIYFGYSSDHTEFVSFFPFVCTHTHLPDCLGMPVCVCVWFGLVAFGEHIKKEKRERERRGHQGANHILYNDLRVVRQKDRATTKMVVAMVVVLVVIISASRN